MYSIKRTLIGEAIILLNKIRAKIGMIGFSYLEDLEKQEECGVVVPERLSEQHVTTELLLAKPRSFSNLPAFLDLDDSK